MEDDAIAIPSGGWQRPDQESRRIEDPDTRGSVPAPHQPADDGRG